MLKARMTAGLRHATPDLALFVAVARCASITHASRMTGVPAATLSRRLSALEGEVGVRLLVRTPRRFGLTAEGERMLAAVESPLAALGEAYDAVVEQGRAPAGLLRITTTADFGSNFLAPLVAEFLQLHPAVEVELDLSARRVDLTAERFDLAIRVGPLPDSRLTARRLAVIPTHLYASPAYLDARGRPQHPAELAAHACLAMPHMAGLARLRRGDEQVDAPLRGRVQVNTMAMAHKLCLEGLGVAALNALVATGSGEHPLPERVLPDWTLEPATFYAVTTTRLLPSRTRAFIDLARRRLAQPSPHHAHPWRPAFHR